MTEQTDHERCEVPEIFRFVPPFPERTGYHWIRRYRGGPAIPLWWNATWAMKDAAGWGKWAQPDREDKWEYCGPCPSPDDNPRAGAENAPPSEATPTETECGPNSEFDSRDGGQKCNHWPGQVRCGVCGMGTYDALVGE